MNDTRHIVHAMRRSGNHPGIIERWKNNVAGWAEANRTDPNAAAVNAWLPLWQPRPFYTADELAPMWPALAIITGFTQRWPEVLKSPARLANELDYLKLPRLRDRPEFFVCERIHYWRDKTTEEILREIPHAFG